MFIVMPCALAPIASRRTCSKKKMHSAHSHPNKTLLNKTLDTATATKKKSPFATPPVTLANMRRRGEKDSKVFRGLNFFF
jgi:hypothetical protein